MGSVVVGVVVVVLSSCAERFLSQLLEIGLAARLVGPIPAVAAPPARVALIGGGRCECLCDASGVCS